MSFSFNKTTTVPASDRRYRMRILLVATERPRYWRFFCPKCGSATGAELSGTMVSLTDVADADASPDYHPVPVAIECNRKFCRVVFEFETLSGK